MTDVPRSTSRRKLLAATGSATALGLAGCLGDENGGDDEGDDHDDHDDHDHDDGHDEIGVEEFEILDRDHDEEVLVYVHGDHWHDDPLEVPHDDNLSLGAYIEDEDGDEVELGDGLELTGEVVEGANEVVEIESHGDHVHVHGEEDGFTDVVFQLVEDGDVVYETPELETEVGHHDHDDDGHGHVEVEDLEIIDRSDDEVVADIHGDHWHGELPHVHVDDNISLGAVFTDDHGDEIPIGSDEEYELAVSVADDAADEIVEIDSDEHWHGDHVHIYGESEGETEVVFKLWHDDHADWESPPIEIEVEDH
ncbi:hypothetical protein [Natronobacterium texcoconense]|uniref:Zinc transport system substrate-binding protein n=1 Tax=Natronobacterium texcoconense TaxID=1095778 RepID=A0A1H1EQ82_NATTX|nr:hypothetical protein [Natronobacterium texcoconense]SDQ90659.1 hypothetical protein SAMN04489842_1653 [Natronobacterium texcoconense]